MFPIDVLPWAASSYPDSCRFLTSGTVRQSKALRRDDGRCGIKHANASTAVQIINGAMLTVRLPQIIIDQRQVACQDLQVGMSHDPLQSIDVHPGTQAPQGKGAAKGMGMTVINVCGFTQPPQ